MVTPIELNIKLLSYVYMYTVWKFYELLVFMST